MVNRKKQFTDYMFLILISILAVFLIFYTWNLLRFQPIEHQNSVQKKILIKEDILDKMKNPPFLTIQPKSQNEGRINPFKSY